MYLLLHDITKHALSSTKLHSSFFILFLKLHTLNDDLMLLSSELYEFCLFYLLLFCLLLIYLFIHFPVIYCKSETFVTFT